MPETMMADVLEQNTNQHRNCEGRGDKAEAIMTDRKEKSTLYNLRGAVVTVT